MDASAGIFIASRRGLGKVKHIDTCHLWVQKIVDQGRIRLRKVNTQDMLADLMTKPLDGQTAMKLLGRMGYSVRSGKHELALGKASTEYPKGSQEQQSVIPTREVWIWV